MDDYFKRLAYTDPHIFIEKMMEQGIFKGEQKNGKFVGEVNLNKLTNSLQEYLSAKVTYSLKNEVA